MVIYFKCLEFKFLTSNPGNLQAADALNQKIAEDLRAKGHRPYVIPVGGTTPVGTWGYLQACPGLGFGGAG